MCVIPVRDGLLTRSHGIQLYHHTLDDLVHGFSVLSSPPNLDEKLVERRLILDKSVVHVLYDQQSLLEGFQEIFAVSLSDNTGVRGRIMNWEAGPKDAPRHRVAFEACLTRYL